ncbi:murein biosynthesis integral membrane protein MurJ [Shimia thalassica]|uniref:murein biosynthesis integral membrane protein MurJ n=1 Tax=Shimia thalassica TaxID=1715693 RepID=UPI00249534E0|nr:murein biosynthesis integral membrane protein MurJ [Shimia thalassica]MDO6481306.1 murein biosynthesis integral membrane protein MurJ [Shimia thalassica]MDO6485831.1 murein biosynthesis integral membrane protein MurJ [Shimia thalassica]MDO6521560.1 murein biosynthesis integral membrane protein MurJ [Shimia thalassica]MDO6800460.1 murein biosynthesis integral membrane protein MurJ [Shimia thalassica]
MKQIRLMRSFLTVGGWTMASRVLGFVRDALIFAMLGTGPLYEAYVVAFRLPNMFRRFFAEGAFNMAFVPMFSKRLEGDENALGFAREAFAGLATILIVLTLIAQLAMPWLVWALASGFSGQEQFDLSVDFGRIAFPYILFISLAALLSGILNATGRFAAAAAAPVLLNILLVGGILTAQAFGWDVARTLIWMIPVAGVAQLLLVGYAAAKAGFSMRLQRPRWSGDMKHLVKVAVPAALAGGVVQVNLLVGQQVASYFDHAVAWLYTADRLYQLPLGVVGIAVGIVLLPDLSRRLKAHDDAGARTALSRAGEIALALTIPCAVALIIIPMPLVSVLFERGKATSDDTAAIAVAVAIYGLGLPAFVLQKILQPLFFAREDTKSPFRYALWAMFVNAAVAIGLAPVIGWVAPAIATTLAGWVMVALLMRGTRPMGYVARFDERFQKRLPRICVASAVMGAELWVALLFLGPMLGTDYWRVLGLAILVLSGSITYFGVGQLIGAFHLSDFKRASRRNI